MKAIVNWIRISNQPFFVVTSKGSKKHANMGSLNHLYYLRNISSVFAVQSTYKSVVTGSNESMNTIVKTISRKCRKI